MDRIQMDTLMDRKLGYFTFEKMISKLGRLENQLVLTLLWQKTDWGVVLLFDT